MKKISARLVTFSIILSILSGCASSTTMKPLKVHSSADMRELPIKAQKTYCVKFTDGTEQMVEGSTIVAETQSLNIYSPASERWTSYPLSSIDEVYLNDVDQLKKGNNAAMITGAAVLAAFLGVTAGGYFIEKQLR